MCEELSCLKQVKEGFKKVELFLGEQVSKMEEQKRSIDELQKRADTYAGWLGMKALESKIQESKEIISQTELKGEEKIGKVVQAYETVAASLPYPEAREKVEELKNISKTLPKEDRVIVQQAAVVLQDTLDTRFMEDKFRMQVVGFIENWQMKFQQEHDLRRKLEMDKASQALTMSMRLAQATEMLERAQTQKAKLQEDQKKIQEEFMRKMEQETMMATVEWFSNMMEDKGREIEHLKEITQVELEGIETEIRRLEFEIRNEEHIDTSSWDIYLPKPLQEEVSQLIREGIQPSTFENEGTKKRLSRIRDLEDALSKYIQQWNRVDTADQFKKLFKRILGNLNSLFQLWTELLASLPALLPLKQRDVLLRKEAISLLREKLIPYQHEAERSMPQPMDIVVLEEHLPGGKRVGEELESSRKRSVQGGGKNPCCENISRVLKDIEENPAPAFQKFQAMMLGTVLASKTPDELRQIITESQEQYAKINMVEPQSPTLYTLQIKIGSARDTLNKKTEVQKQELVKPMRPLRTDITMDQTKELMEQVDLRLKSEMSVEEAKELLNEVEDYERFWANQEQTSETKQLRMQLGMKKLKISHTIPKPIPQRKFNETADALLVIVQKIHESKSDLSITQLPERERVQYEQNLQLEKETHLKILHDNLQLNRDLLTGYKQSIRQPDFTNKLKRLMDLLGLLPPR